MDSPAADEILHLDTRKWTLWCNDGNRVYKLVRVLGMDILGASKSTLDCA